MKRTIYAMHPDALREYLKLQDEVRIAHRGMTAVEMRETIAQIYASAIINGVPGGTENAPLYSVDSKGVAHIPIVGTLTQKASPCAGLFGPETEYSYIKGAVAAANSDPMVGSIQFEMDSPGGYLDGLDETAQAVAASEKSTSTLVHNMAASAAYWIASQTDTIDASSPADQIGSIGVAIELTDTTEADAQAGIKSIVLTSTDAPNKRPDITTQEGQAQVVADLDALHGVFVQRVASGRGTTPQNVTENYGRGGVLIAGSAMKAGMIDHVLGVSIARDNTPGVAGVAARAADDKKEVKGMEFKELTLEALVKERPELVAAATDAGVKQERERVNALRRWEEADPDNLALSEVVSEAIASGKSENDVKPRLEVAIRNHKTGADGGENAPGVKTSITATGAAADAADLSPDDVAALALIRESGAQMTVEEYRKYHKGGK